MQSRILFAALLLVAQAATAQVIYTWKDAKGVQQFSHSPPNGVDAKPWRGSIPGADSTTAPAIAGQSGPAASGPKSMAQQEQEFRERRAAKTEAEEKSRQEAARKAEKDKYCDSLRRNIAMFERGGRIGAPDAKGEFQEYSDAQIQAELANRRQQLQKDCR